MYYCANCGKTFGPHDRAAPTIMPGWSKPVLTCYDDRLCYSKSKALPVIIMKDSVPRKKIAKNTARGLAKYLRKYKFTGWWISWKK
jgi:hypothetical protein